ncbi:hypothetical protein M9H77_07178 [Catharanthus roseus]|uniref:Uncharacterized protein n=1 Tax=Catharanthus roseus TaxID=4058 RepID=A0ACC0BUL3_CATRO|nr:hypothetical protein M9H77_07178 [Catharanthus roseus]
MGSIERNVRALSAQIDRQESMLVQRRGFHNFDNLTPRRTMRDKDSSSDANLKVRDDLSQNFDESFKLLRTQGGGRFGLEVDEMEGAWEEDLKWTSKEYSRRELVLGASDPQRKAKNDHTRIMEAKSGTLFYSFGVREEEKFQ